jgi:hypothetical protein
VKYIVIDTAGKLHERHAPGYAVALRDVGPEGWARVRLGPTQTAFGPVESRVAAYVNDCGLIIPHYDRNVVGACVILALGAPWQPYAGPVVLTGWEPDSEDTEIRALTDEQTAAVARIHADVRAVLDGADPTDRLPRLCQAIRQAAVMVRSGEVPPALLLTDPADVEAWLRGAR